MVCLALITLPHILHGYSNALNYIINTILYYYPYTDHLILYFTICRQPLQDVILRLRVMLESSDSFEGVVPILEDLLEPPDTENVNNSFQFLHYGNIILY